MKNKQYGPVFALYDRKSGTRIKCAYDLEDLVPSIIDRYRSDIIELDTVNTRIYDTRFTKFLNKKKTPVVFYINRTGRTESGNKFSDYLSPDQINNVISLIREYRSFVLDKFTFGKSQAAINLVDMLERRCDQKILHGISRHFHNFARRLKEVDKISDKKLKVYVLQLLSQQKFKNKFKYMNDAEDCDFLKIFSHLNNVKHGLIKKYMKKAIKDMKTK